MFIDISQLKIVLLMLFLLYLTISNAPPRVVVSFRLTETDYQSSERDLQINAVVSKSMRIANPVTISLTPLTIDQAVAGGITLPVGTPPDDNRFSPNRAKGMS